MSGHIARRWAVWLPGSIFGIGGHCGARSLDITFDAHSSALVHTGRAVAANFDELQAETGQLVAVGDVP